MRPHCSAKLLSYSKHLAVLAGLALSLLSGHHAEGIAPVQQGMLTPQEQRGKQIYVRGTSASGQAILAYLGEESLEVDGSVMACANCHGLDGQGKPEGGVTPSNITWEALTKPYGVMHPNGRKHSAYTERALELALTRGLDPDGNKLLNVMPRYQMSRADTADLIAYLKRLGTDRDPGITENSIKIGTVVPTKGALADMGQAVKAVISAYFDELNSQGGIYHRRLELKVAETGETPASTRANVERLLQDEQVFALTGAITAGADQELFTLAAERAVPLVGPLTLYPSPGAPLNRQVFYLLSGLDGQARVLVNFAAQKSPANKTGVAVVYPATESARSVADAIKDQYRKDGWGAPETYEYAPADYDAAAIARKLSQTGRAAIFFLGSGAEALALLREAEKLHWSPELYLPGAITGQEILTAPASFDHKIFLSFPTSPAAQTQQGLKDFRALAEKHQLPAHHLAAQLSAYAAAQVLVEGLKRGGRDLSREKLIAALEGLYEFESGVTPALTYNPNRRIGALGAYIVSLDLNKKQFVPVSGWLDAN